MAFSNCKTNLYSVHQSNQSQKIWRDLAGSTLYTPTYGLRFVDDSFARKFVGSWHPQTDLLYGGMNIGIDGQPEIAHDAGRKNYIQIGLPFDGEFH